MKIIRSLVILSIVSLITLVAFGFLLKAPKIQAYGNTTGHPLLTEKIAELYNAIYDPDLTQEDIQSLIMGSSDEDTPPRWINHFYDPTTTREWLGKRLGEIKEETIRQVAMLAFAKYPDSAPNWIQDQELQNEEYYFYQGDRTFNSAVLYSQENNEDQAYYTLGYVLHALEDMSVPAHTRQDTHFDMQVPNIFEELLQMKFDEGEPYEKWVEENGQIGQATIDNLKNNYQPVCNSLENCMNYVADYSNGNFFSQDSVLDKEYSSPKAVRYIPIGAGVSVYGNNNQLLFTSEKDPFADKTKIVLDNQGYWNELSQKAILAGVEVVKYFEDQKKKTESGQLVLERPAKPGLIQRTKSISPYGEIARFYNYAIKHPEEIFVAYMNEYFDWGQDGEADYGSSPTLTLADLGLTLDQAQERFDELQEKIDWLTALQEQQNDQPEWPQIELPTFDPIEPPDLELPQIENPLEQIEQMLDNTQASLVSAVLAKSGGGGGAVFPKILITEVQIASSVDEKDEFVELYNPTDQNVDLEKWYIQKRGPTGQGYSTFVSHNAFKGNISAKGYLLVGRLNSVFEGIADVTTGQPLAENNTLVLKNPNGVVSDKVGWGQAQDFEAVATPNPVLGKSLARNWDSASQKYQDTDNNLADFGEQNPTPREVNVNVPPVSPVDTTAPTASFNLDPVQATLNFPVSFTIKDLGQGNVSPSGLAAYQFQWKKEGGDWNTDASQNIINNPETYSGSRDFTAPEDEKIYYFQVKAKDVKGNESNWLLQTPVQTWVRAEKVILINEIQIAGQTTKDEFVELYNPNDYDVNLESYSLKKKTSTGNESNLVSSSAFTGIIPSKGYFLIVPQLNADGTPNYTGTAVPDLYYSGASYSIADNNTVLLYNNFGNLVDKVGLGTALDSEGNPIPNPDPGQSIERKITGLDTNNNSQDFRISAEPTPKGNATNVSIEDITDYNACMSSSSPGTTYYYLTIKWHSLSSVSFYQVQYNRNDIGWEDWYLQTQDTQGTFRTVYALLYDNVYKFRARAQDTDGNLGDWKEITIDLSNPIVINEVALWGTDAGPNGEDQWIELYNKSDADVDITGWHIISGISGGNRDIILQGIVPAKGYFVLEKTNDQVITDVVANQVFDSGLLSLGYLYLTQQNNRRMDDFYIPMMTGWSEPAFMQGENHYSMERISPYSFGGDNRNWELNDGQIINGQDRQGNTIYGTPGQKNSNYLLYIPVNPDFVEDFTLPKLVDGQTQSTYFVNSDIIILEGATITIEPGVVMKFSNYSYGINVQGTLKAIGTAEEPILFTSSQEIPQQDNWAGIYFTETSKNSELDNVIIQYAGGSVGSLYGAGIKIKETNVSIKNSTIENSDIGLWLINTPSTIDGNEITNSHRLPFMSGGDGIRIQGGSPTIINNYITSNDIGIYIGSYYDPSGTEIFATPYLENNIYANNGADIWPPSVGP